MRRFTIVENAIIHAWSIDNHATRRENADTVRCRVHTCPNIRCRKTNLQSESWI